MESARAEKPKRPSYDAEDEAVDSETFDPAVAHAARIYDYLLGGKDNFAADRKATKEVVSANPAARCSMLVNRAFLGRAVRYLAGEAGIRQFLDVGTGIPRSGNTHQMAQRVAPDSLIMYVDNDPVVLAHAQALLTSTREGAISYLGSDIRHSDTIVEKARTWLDFGKPIAIMLLMILHLIPDPDDPWQAVSLLVDAVPAGSYLVISHPASDVQAGIQAEMIRRLNERMPLTPMTLRSRTQVSRFFGDLEMVPPGLVPLNSWRPNHPDYGEDIAAYGGMGRKAD